MELDGLLVTPLTELFQKMQLWIVDVFAEPLNKPPAMPPRLPLNVQFTSRELPFTSFAPPPCEFAKFPAISELLTLMKAPPPCWKSPPPWFAVLPAIKQRSIKIDVLWPKMAPPA